MIMPQSHVDDKADYIQEVDTHEIGDISDMGRVNRKDDPPNSHLWLQLLD